MRALALILAFASGACTAQAPASAVPAEAAARPQVQRVAAPAPLGDKRPKSWLLM